MTTAVTAPTLTPTLGLPSASDVEAHAKAHPVTLDGCAAGLWLVRDPSHALPHVVALRVSRDVVEALIPGGGRYHDSWGTLRVFSWADGAAFAPVAVR